MKKIINIFNWIKIRAYFRNESILIRTLEERQRDALYTIPIATPSCHYCHPLDQLNILKAAHFTLSLIGGRSIILNLLFVQFSFGSICGEGKE